MAKPFNTNSSNENKHAEDAFYKINKPEEENKPKLFNFEIKKILAIKILEDLINSNSE